MAGNKQTQQYPGLTNDEHSNFQTWQYFCVELQTSAHKLKSQQILAKTRLLDAACGCCQSTSNTIGKTTGNTLVTPMVTPLMT